MTIHETVRQAQDTLVRVRINQRPALFRRIFPPTDKPWPIYGFPPVQYPQSLGELCIELSQDAFRAWKMGTTGPRGFTLHMSWVPGQDRGITPGEWERNIRERGSCHTTTADIHALRIAMYHKEKT